MKACARAMFPRPSTAMPALLAGLFLAMAAPAHAQPAPATAQAPIRYTFNIPPQPLTSALPLFGQQSGRQVTADTEAVRGVASAGVQGNLTLDEALQRLLAGTGMTYSFGAGSAIAVHRLVQGAPGATQLDPVQVQANIVPPQAEIGNLPAPYAGGQVARGGRIGDLGYRDYMDTPFSTTVYTNQYIQNNQARTLVDALADDPSIRSAYGQGSWDDRMNIRGFYLDGGDISFNGLFGINPLYSTDLSGIERVEVFRGPTALLSGMSPVSAVGGTVNVVPKRATDAPITQATMMYSMNGQFGGQVDVGRRFGPDNKVGVRINGSFTAGNTAVANTSDQLASVTLGIDFRGETTRFDMDFGYQNRRIISPRGGASLMPGVPVPVAPSAQSNFYQPWEFWATNDLYGMFRVEHDISPELTAFLKLGGLQTRGAFLVGFPQIMDAQGNTIQSPFKSVDMNGVLSGEAGLRAHFSTGPLEHEPVFSASYIKIDRFTAQSYFPDVASNLYAPVVNPSPDLSGTNGPMNLYNTTVQRSLGAMDAISFADKRVQLIGGFRLQQIQVSNYDFFTGVPAQGFDQMVVTPAVSFVVRPWSFLSLYGNYIEGLEQGAVADPGLANAGQVFPPFVSRQFEAGVKLDLGKFGATLGLFQITQQQSFIDPASNSLVVDGQQRNRGIELTMFGEPIPGIRPLGGFTVFDAIQTNTLDGTNNGKLAPGVPPFQANLGLEWDTPFLRGLTLSGRMLYTGPTYVDAENTQQLAAWTRFDVGARYRFERAAGKPVTLRADIVNVGNNNYWMGATGALVLGQPLTFRTSLTVDF